MELDWLAIVAATVVGMIVAGAWYGKAFTTLWSSLTEVAAADSQKASRRNMTQLLAANGMTAVGLTAGINSRRWLSATVRCGWPCWPVSQPGWRSRPPRLSSTTLSSWSLHG